jgi:hypothetical protein
MLFFGESLMIRPQVTELVKLGAFPSEHDVVEAQIENYWRALNHQCRTMKRESSSSYSVQMTTTASRGRSSIWSNQPRVGHWRTALDTQTTSGFSVYDAA